MFVLYIVDVFHWECLNRYAQQLPTNTAPAGYTCPLCKAGIFPAQNMVSPVIEALKELLSKVNWARAGLGLPLVCGYKHSFVIVTINSWILKKEYIRHLRKKRVPDRFTVYLLVQHYV